jgi:pSer/pThr/pTyr-binding forkhead associated (FHA) protein
MDENERGGLAAWLQSEDGNSVSLAANISFGRSTSNQIVLADEKVSRRHALVHAQDENEYWLVDLGSSNGTYLNDRRVAQPVKLQNEDRIEIAGFRFVFREASNLTRTIGCGTLSGTVLTIRATQCWLLLADIEDSTALARRLPQDQLPVVTGQWFSACKQILDDTAGTINKYLGDGFLAYWPETPGSLAQVVRALSELKALQSQGQPAFRLAVHHGEVLMGGVASMGEECLMGNEVNFVFRMEKVCNSVGKSRLLSAAAQEKLTDQLQSNPCGRHPVPSFAGAFLFHTF